METQRFCKDCAWFKHSPRVAVSGIYIAERNLCMHPTGKRHPVTGEPVLTNAECLFERTLGRCGEEAVFFKAKAE